ncbi:MAG: DUF4912 domain-containing protein [Clostridia bacterium]
MTRNTKEPKKEPKKVAKKGEVEKVKTTILEESKTPKKKAVAKKNTVSTKNETKASSTRKTKKVTSSTVKKTGVKKETTSTTSKKATQKKRVTTHKATSKKPNIEVIEYYDLPYRYNDTVVKILAQTPKTLFIYWDISDEDRNRFLKEYGKNFFNDTRPVLIIHNETKNYAFEIEINDFANSWYLNVEDTNCVYQIELGRREKANTSITIPNNYIYITSSNELESPNDHILFAPTDSVLYENVKSHKKIAKSIKDLSYQKSLKEIYSIYDLYQEIYQKESLAEFDLNNTPSSLNSSNFK